MSAKLGFLFLAASGLGFAQSAAITGRITDPSGGVTPQAQITVRNTDTGISRLAVSNDQGYYTVPALPPGNYEMTVEKQGFQPAARTGIRLNVDEKARIDVSLELGSVMESVQVSAQAVLLESESSTLGQLVQNKQILELPLLGRDPYALAMLVPGARTSAGLNNLPVDIITTSFASVNGSRGNQNEFLLDGAPNTSPAGNAPVVFPSVDGVQEFKVETNSFSAEYGRSAGGVFNVVTRSGGNDAHLSLYDFLRNDKLNANDYFANRSGLARPPFRYNQFGASAGGPVEIPRLYRGRNRTFFFFSWEAVRFAQGTTFSGTVPDPVQLTGDFSRLRNAAGNPVTIYDPLTTQPGSAGGFVRSPFPGNMIPANRIDPVARSLSKFWPAPNAPGNPITGVNNYAQTGANRISKDMYSFRVDHHVSGRNQFFTRFTYDDTPWIRAKAYGRDNIASPSAGPQDFGRRNAVVEDTYILNPSLLATLRYSYARLGNFRQSWSSGYDITNLGFPAGLGRQFGPPASFPVILISGFGVSSLVPNTLVGGTLGAGDLIRVGTDSHAWEAQATKSWSKHNVKAGFEFRLIRGNMLQHADQGTQFSFSPAYTQGPNPAASTATAGSALASFLLGAGNGSVNQVPALATQTLYYAGFLQDDWKAAPRLTLNLGLRYDYETPRTDRFNQFANFSYSAVPPLQAPGLNLHGALLFVGTNGLSRYQANPDRNNFAPRFGFACRLNDKTVFRGGAGLFYAPTTGIGTAADAFGTSGFSAATNEVSSVDGFTPINFLRNPYPSGVNQPTGSSLGRATLLGQSIQFFDRGNRVPYSEQWNANLQRVLPAAILLEVGYAGSHGLKFPTTLTLNQLPGSALALGNALREQVPNPFYGQIATGILATPTVARAQLLRPYPQFDNVSSANADWAASTYHALEVKLEKRYANGLTLLAAYTYSKLMDYATGTFSGEALGASTIQDWNNLRAERSVSNLDQTNRLIVNGVYELPLARHTRGAIGKIARGWELSGILSVFTGSPLGMSSSVNNTFSQGGGQRPNWNGSSPRLSNPTPDHWFDTSVFSNPPAYAFGNVSRTLSGLRGAGVRNADFAVHKNTHLREKLNLQFRAECFNLMNHPQFAPPGQSLGTAQFGVVSAQQNLPRVVQFGLKLIL
jgi:hypothetical protein